MSGRDDKELTENENWRVHDFLDSKYSENFHRRTKSSNRGCAPEKARENLSSPKLVSFKLKHREVKILTRNPEIKQVSFQTQKQFSLNKTIQIQTSS